MQAMELSEKKRPQVLVVEDDASQRPKLEAILKSLVSDIKVDWAENLQEAKKMVGERPVSNFSCYDLMIADVFLGKNEDGIGFLIDCKKKFPKQKMLLTSSSSKKRILSENDAAIDFPFLSKTESVRQYQKDLYGHLVKSQYTPEIKNRLKNAFITKESSPMAKDFGMMLLRFMALFAAIAVFFFINSKYLQQSQLRSESFKGASKAPLMKAIGGNATRAKINSMLSGGLTPLMEHSLVVGSEKQLSLAAKKLFE